MQIPIAVAVKPDAGHCGVDAGLGCWYNAIVEFTDFHCPFCRRARSTVEELLAKFGDEVKHAHRDFPIERIHPQAPRAQEAYVHSVRLLAAHFHKPPDQLTEDDLRQYFLYLANVKHFARASFTIALCGIKFFYERSLGREWQCSRPSRGAPRPPLWTPAAPPSGAGGRAR